MDKNILSKLLNDNKRLEIIKKDSRKLFKVVLKAFNGKKIVSETSSFIDGLQHNTTLIFKPVKAFTKKAIKGFNKFDLAQQRIEDEEEQRKRKEVLFKTNKSNKTDLSTIDKSDNGFVNWFDLTPETNVGELKKARVMSIKKADGSIVPLITTDELDDELDGNY